MTDQPQGHDNQQDNQQDRPTSGTITELKVQVKDSNRYSVFLDDQYAFGIHVDLVLSESLAKGQILDPETVARICEADESIRAKQRALSLLAHRPRTRFELKQRLGRYGYAAAAVEKAIERLDELGHLDDRAFALEFVRARVAAKGFGRRRLSAELAKKGVARELVEEALTEVEETHDPVETALAQAQRILPRLQREPDPKKRRTKLYGHLSRRGFEPTVIQQAIDRTLED